MFICLLVTLALLVFGYNYAQIQMQKIVNSEIGPVINEWNTNNIRWRADYVPTRKIKRDWHSSMIGTKDAMILMARKAFYNKAPGSLKVYKR